MPSVLTVEDAGESKADRLLPVSTPSAQHAQKKTGEQVRVLAVDDDPHALRYVRDTFSQSAYVPIVTGYPEEAAT